MAQGGVTTTGLKEMRRAVEQLPTRVSAALRAVAWRTSRRMREDAQRRLRQQTRGTGATADAIKITEHESEKLFEVIAEAPHGKPANLPLWLEYGTVKMDARPFMRPSLEAQREQYRREMDAAAVRTVEEALR